MTWERKAAFIGTSFSCADILGVLYGGFYHQDDDLMIMSKGHGASAWYAALAEAGAFDRERLFKEFNVSGFQYGGAPQAEQLARYPHINRLPRPWAWPGGRRGAGQKGE